MQRPNSSFTCTTKLAIGINDNPGPGNYSMSSLSGIKPTNISYSKFVPSKNPMKAPNPPGPADYRANESYAKINGAGSSFSLRPRSVTAIQQAIKNQNKVGPGTYENNYSTINGENGSKIYPKTAVPKRINNLPGAGSYNVDESYKKAVCVSPPKHTFGKPAPKTKKTIIAPGPASYSVESSSLKLRSGGGKMYPKTIVPKRGDNSPGPASYNVERKKDTVSFTFKGRVAGDTF
ncbi:SHIPPO_1-like protein [Hexamita inflata]|uniref:SHIPPO 1-like protein n=1 Tax=Hexamita inflata TaxID=28002 RepID=A0AA86N8G6_9EUKA|nr:SHIPPO 1-like protein [Hexamita inflata]